MKLNNLHHPQVSLSLVPLAQCCAMDLPHTPTPESKRENSTNKHENFEFPQDSCSHKEIPESISLIATCSHQDQNHLLILPSKIYRRVVVDAFVYCKHSKFHGSTMALTLQLKHNQRMVVKVETTSPLLATRRSPQGRAYDLKQSTAGR